MNIVTVPNALLLETSSEVSFPLSKADKMLATNILEMVRKDEGSAGLAAIQVGEKKRIVVISDKKRIPKILYNPKILMLVGSILEFPEGCLSIPNRMYLLKRNSVIKYSYQNEKGKLITEKAKGWEAIVIQHEIDHTNGILITQKGRLINDEQARKYYEKESL